MSRIGVHNIVLAYMPGMGKVNSALLAAHFCHSFPNVTLGLVVGICGGVPFIRDVPYGPRNKEILLGDIIISTGVVQYDLGRLYSKELVPKDTLNDKLDRQNHEIRAFLHKMEGLNSRILLEESTPSHLAVLLGKRGFERVKYQGADKNILYEPSYRHKHHSQAATSCAECESEEDQVCDLALDSTCADLKCSPEKQIHRDRLTKLKENQTHQAKVPSPLVHFGLVASGDSVVKSAHHRDVLASRKEEVIAFEMEGAGAWDTFPTVVIKSVVDYADSHKSYLWQEYGAACAAACMKAFVNEWRTTDEILYQGAGSSASGLTARQTGEQREVTKVDFGTPSKLEVSRQEVDNAYSLIHRRRKDSMKDDLVAAIRILSRPELRSADLDTSHLQRTYWGLMVAEKALSCYKGFGVAEQLEHVHEALRYGKEVGNIVLQSPSASLRAQLSLEQSILKGRRAKLNIAKGKHTDDSKNVILDAIKGIDRALQELQAVDLASYNEVSEAALKWRNGLDSTTA